MMQTLFIYNGLMLAKWPRHHGKPYVCFPGILVCKFKLINLFDIVKLVCNLAQYRVVKMVSDYASNLEIWVSFSICVF